MSLNELIRKKTSSVGLATVTVATLATHEGEKRAFEVWNGPTVASVATVTVATATRAKTASASRMLHFADREPLTVAFTPAATHAEVLDAYPSALAAEPVEPGRRQPDVLLTGDQEEAIRAWLAAIGETDEATVAEVLTRCRQDEEVRRYFLDRAGAIVADDDRRCCNQCGNLRAGVCAIASPGGVVSANRGYRPAQDVPHRCAGYAVIQK